MSEHPCSSDHEGEVTTSPGLKGSELPLVELDKEDPSQFQGQEPGLIDRRTELIIDRSSVRREEGDQGEQ